MNQLRMSRGRNGKSSASREGTGIIVWNRCSYQVPEMDGTNASKNEKHKLYKSTVWEISRGGGEWATKVGSHCVCFVYMGAQVKTQVKNGLSNIFGFRYQTIYVSDQVIFIFKHSGLHYEGSKKPNVSDPLTAAQRRSVHFFVFHDDGPPWPGWSKL